MKPFVYAMLCSIITLQSYHAMAAHESVGTMYRYKDKNGQAVINNVLPPEFANSGYEILSPRGNVIEKVPAKRTQAEIEAAKAEEEQKQLQVQLEKQKAAEKAAQMRRDEILLKSYSSEKDIENSKNSKISSIHVLENITKEHISQLNRQLEEARTQAANYERMGRNIPENVFKTIEESKRQIMENEAFLKAKSDEKDKIIKNFNDDLERFRLLKAKEEAAHQGNSAPITQ